MILVMPVKLKIQREMTCLLSSLEGMPSHSLESHQTLKRINLLAIKLRQSP